MKTVMATGTFDIIHPGHGFFLEEARKLGGRDARLVVVLARDSTVRARKRTPIVGENQRLEVVRMLKPVDEAYLGSETDMFEIVHRIKPDIIAIGPIRSSMLMSCVRSSGGGALNVRLRG